MNIQVKSGMKAGDLCLMVHNAEKDAINNLGGFTCKPITSNVSNCRGPESAKADLDKLGLALRYKYC